MSCDDPWSEDYEDSYHEEDFEMSEDELAEMKKEEEIAELDDKEAYESKLEEGMQTEYEYDEVVGGRDKKPILSVLNKKRLSKYEMDDLFNKLGE